MVEYKIPTLDIIEELADNMRNQDVAEIEAIHTEPLDDVLTECVEISDKVDAVYIHGDLVGIVGTRDMGEYAIPWFLGTDFVNTHRKIFMSESKKIINSMPDKLFNMVHADNTVSVRWLRALGFTLEEPEECGTKRELFCKFHRGFKSV